MEGLEHLLQAHAHGCWLEASALGHVSLSSRLLMTELLPVQVIQEKESVHE